MNKKSFSRTKIIPLPQSKYEGTGINDSKRLLHNIKNNHFVNVESLLKNGANPNCQDKKETPALTIAAKHGFIEIVDLLIDHGADLNKQNASGETALIAAAIELRSSVVHRLITCGADIHATDQDGDSALDISRDQDDRDSQSIIREAMEENQTHFHEDDIDLTGGELPIVTIKL